MSPVYRADEINAVHGSDKFDYDKVLDINAANELIGKSIVFTAPVYRGNWQSVFTAVVGEIVELNGQVTLMSEDMKEIARLGEDGKTFTIGDSDRYVTFEIAK